MDIGAIADDFTGATDLATGLRSRGYRVAVTIGPAPVAGIDDADAVVVALKSRTAPVAAAVSESMSALRALRLRGARQIYVKYCSTFDSTDRGNIGPVLDAVTEELGADRTIVVPAYPANGRTVYRGHLFVGADLLENSSMRHHPLTPMTRSRLRDILTPQTRASITEVSIDEVRAGEQALRARITEAPAGYLIVDAIDDDDLRIIARASRDLAVVSGGAGLALGLEPRGPRGGDDFPSFTGRRLVVCGSASSTTRSQIAAATAAGLPTMKLDIAATVADTSAVTADVITRLAALDADSIPVVYSVGEPGDLATGTASDAVEHALARIARIAAEELGFDRIIVAGGETSGAVVRELGIETLRIGPPIAPGVCWSAAVSATGSPVAIALKSGNFGGEDMFIQAWEGLS